MQFTKAESFIIHAYEDDMQRIEYKNRVIQMCPVDSKLYFFVMKEDGNEDKEFSCLEKAIKYIDVVTKD